LRILRLEKGQALAPRLLLTLLRPAPCQAADRRQLESF
jgi:hypothetical protein